MPNVIIRRYNTFFDHQTNVQFNPVLDKTTGHYIGLAQIADDLVPHFARNPAYEVISDSRLAEITSGSAVAVEPPAKKVKDEIAKGVADISSLAPATPK